MSNAFRKDQRHLSATERQQVNDIKQIAQDLHDVIDMLPASRPREIAQMKLEECVMWSIKAVADAL
jgi:hypothetical protein